MHTLSTTKTTNYHLSTKQFIQTNDGGDLVPRLFLAAARIATAAAPQALCITSFFNCSTIVILAPAVIALLTISIYWHPPCGVNTFNMSLLTISSTARGWTLPPKNLLGFEPMTQRSQVDSKPFCVMYLQVEWCCWCAIVLMKVCSFCRCCC